MKTLSDFNFNGKKVLIRCDFNVPLSDDGQILDDFRIKEAIPTIRYLVENNARVIIISHLGEPEGKIIPKLSLDLAAQRLAELSNFTVTRIPDLDGNIDKEAISKIGEGEIFVLENLRFHIEETENNLEFAKDLASLADIYVNEAFSVDHRAHASVALVPKFLPSAAGLLLEKEITNLNKVLESPARPMTAIIGGKKVETKTKFINKVSQIADFVLIGDLLEKEIIEKNITLNNPQKVFSAKDHLSDPTIEEDTIKLFTEKIMQSKTVVWNGPLSQTENPQYAQGTLKIANAIIESGAFSVVGGGETIEFIKKQGIINSFSHVSTGGGAVIAYLSGEKLPGIEALDN